MKQLIILVLLLTSSMLGAQFTGPEIPISYYHSDIRTVIAADLLYQFGEPDIIIESGDTAVVMFRNFDGQNFSGPMVLADYFDGISDMVAFDIDSDSDRDILVASGPDGGIFQLINAGAFEFFEQGTIAELGSQITDIKQDHVNNDGDLDIIFARVNPSEIGWIENEGNGDFADPVSLAIDIGYPTQVEAGDMNDDGAMDIVFLSLTQSKLYYLENWGAFFQPHEEIWSSTPGIEDFAIADIDLDGDLDIVLCSMAEDKVLWIEQTDGEFINSHIIDDQAWQVDQIELSDFDLDGDMDVVVSSRLSSSGKWYENAGNGEYEPGQLASPLHSEQVRRLLTVDLDGDGYEDILYSEDRTVGVSINDTSVDFNPLPLISPQIPIPQELTEIDLDSDGDLDILVGGFHELNWLVNQLDEDYGVNNLVDIGFSSSISGIDAGDIDMDDDEDIVYSLNNDSRLLSNDGMEQFETQVTMPDGGGYMGTTLNDLDGDGDLDLLLNHNTTIRVRENLGGGELGPWQDLASDVDRLISLKLEDIDGDGDEDIIAGDVFPSMLSTYENIGGLEFGEQQSWLQGTAGPRDIDLCDIDGDGDKDVVVILNPEDELGYYENDGEGNFDQYHLIICSISNPWSLETGDFDQDGDEDIVVGTNLKLILLQNNGAVGFTQIELSDENYQIWDILASDRDNDGDLDLFLARTFAGYVSYFENHLGEGCMDPAACNYDPGATIDTGCCYSECGCTDLNALNYDPAASCDDGSCEHVLGCTDPNSSNYEPSATLDNGSCLYEVGCTVQGAENYDPDAVCDDGSCGFLVYGIVFYDENENGIMDEEEYGIAQHAVTLNMGQATFITNNEGNFFGNASGSVQYAFEVEEHPLFPFFTTPSLLFFDATEDGWNQEIFFGLSNVAPIAMLDAAIYTEQTGYACDTLVLHDLCIQNLGTNMVNGQAVMTIDTLYQEFIPIYPVDSIVEDMVYLSYDSLVPGENLCMSFYLLTPTVEFIGDILEILYDVFAIDDGEILGELSGVFEQELTCAYDPNDKQVSPIGYTEDHFVHPDSTLEYLIRFQNTGNAPATDVIIRDTIDEGLDLSTFELLAYSHPVFTTVKTEEREVEFYFQDIMLPDSVNNEPESHGLVSFRINVDDDTPLLSELNNTAHIFFDNNPPIVTNTTWSTLYDCSLFEVSFTDNGALLTASEGDSFQWYLNGNPIAGADEQEYTALVDGNYSVQVSIDFPCMSSSSSTFILASSIYELEDSLTVLFPNPMTTSAIVDLGEAKGQGSLLIYDISGKMVRQEVLNLDSGVLTLNRGKLRAGIYLLKIQVEEVDLSIPFSVK